MGHDKMLVAVMLLMASRDWQPCLPMSCCPYSPVLGNVVSAECWDFDFCLPSGLSLVARAGEAKGLKSGLGVAFEGWELAIVKLGVM